LANRSAMRVCQPGPVARQRWITSAGSRSEMSFLGLAERGRPPLLTTARANISSVSSGSSLYSDGFARCASIRESLEPKVRREAGFFSVISFPHAENVAYRAARGVADDHQASGQFAEADDPSFTVVLARVLNLHGQAAEDDSRVLEVEAPILQGLLPLRRVVGQEHKVIVDTKNEVDKDHSNAGTSLRMSHGTKAKQVWDFALAGA